MAKIAIAVRRPQRHAAHRFLVPGPFLGFLTFELLHPKLDYIRRHARQVFENIRRGEAVRFPRGDGMTKWRTGRLHEANRPLHELKPLVLLVRTRSHASGITLRLLTTDLVSGCDKRSVRTADALDLVSQGV